MAARFGMALRHEGISLQDWRVLAALRERNDQRLTELSVRTSIEISTLSRLIGNMETTGLVSRQRAAGDARAIAIDLTVQGEALAARLTPVAILLEEAALAGFTAAESAQLKSMLHRIYDSLASTTAPATPQKPSRIRARTGSGRKSR